jgi:CPA2 family monovalent cation:H+ antiporter-2
MDGGLPGILMLLTLGLAIVLVFQRLGVSALVAYLVTGALAGPSALKLIEVDQLEPVAEVGASLLLFSIGLELDLGGMRRRLRQVLVASGVQIGGTLIAGAGLARLAGIDLPHAVALGACLAMTSSVVLLRVLDERKIRNRNEGQLSLGVSLMQDLSLGPFLLLLSFLAPVGHHAPPWQLGLGLVGVVAGTWLVRRVIGSRVIARIRATKLPELESAFAITLALGAAGLAEQAGLGAALGAFAAGLALGGDEHRAVVERSTRPLMGVTAILFFAAMGALFDVGFVMAHWWEVALLVVASVVLKAPIAAVGVRLAGLPWRSALGSGLILAQVGEFSFVLAAAAFADATEPGLRHLYQLIVAVTCISLAVAPLLTWLAGPLLPRTVLQLAGAPGATVVVAGLGPVGNTVVDLLRKADVPLLLIDRNERLLAPWQGVAGVRTHQGRIEDMEDWVPLIGHRPTLVVLTFPVADASAVVARRLRGLDPDLTIIARAPFTAQVELLRDAGAQYVICDEAETQRALVPLLEQALRSGRGA